MGSCKFLISFSTNEKMNHYRNRQFESGKQLVQDWVIY